MSDYMKEQDGADIALDVSEDESVSEAAEELSEEAISEVAENTAEDEDLPEDDAPVEEDEAEAGEDNDGGESDAPAESEGDEADEAEDGEAPALPLASVVEAVLFAAREPLKLAQIARAVGRRTRQDAVRAAVDELNVQYLETARAFEIAEISGRFQLMSRPEYVRHIMRIYPKREMAEKDRVARLTPAALDTLAIVAYKQPVTRADIEHIRGVACGPALKTLIERGSVRVVGKKADLVGQPLVYATTEAFLAEFGLGSLDELPMRNEFVAMDAGGDILPEEQPENRAEAEPAGDEAGEPEPESVESPEPESEGGDADEGAADDDDS